MHILNLGLGLTGNAGLARALTWHKLPSTSETADFNPELKNLKYIGYTNILDKLNLSKLPVGTDEKPIILINTERNLESWLDAWENHTRGLFANEAIRNIRITLFGQAAFDHSVWSKRYKKHQRDIEKLRKSRSVYSIDIFAENAWETLEDIIGKPPIDRPFPLD